MAGFDGGGGGGPDAACACACCGCGLAITGATGTAAWTTSFTRSATFRRPMGSPFTPGTSSCLVTASM
jgi:hypothetical protein